MSDIHNILNPKSVAIIGASNNPIKVGNALIKSLLNNPSLKIYPVNPRVKEIEGLKAYPSLTYIPDKVDLVIVAIPANKVISAVEEAVNKGVNGILIISSGFREAEYGEGALLQDKLTRISKSAGIRIIGPNTFGFVNIISGVNASFTPMFSKVKKGPIGIVSQSGGICHYIMHNFIEDVGFSYIIHLGNRCDVDFPEIIEYLERDKNTRVITLYIEGVENARELYSAISKASRSKPVIALKAGKASIADKVSKSHTGSLAGNYQIHRGALRQAGAIVVDNVIELINLAKALAIIKKIYVGGVAILSIQAGLGFMALDIIEESEGIIAKFKPQTIDILHKLLPPITMRDNPVDIAFSGLNMNILKRVFQAVSNDENVGLILFIYAAAPPAWSIPPTIVRNVISELEKPIIITYSSTQEDFKNFKSVMENNGIPVYSSLENAAKIAAIISRNAKNLFRYYG